MSPFSFCYWLVFYSLIIYPTWYTPTTSTWDKLVVYHLFYVSLLAIFWGITVIVPRTRELEWPKPGIPTWFYVCCGIYLIALVPLLDQPIITGGDAQLHVSFPAGIVVYLEQIVRTLTKGTLTYQTLSVITLLAVTAVVLYRTRGDGDWAGILNRPLVCSIYLYPFMTVLVYYVASTNLLHGFGEIDLFHRYPPVGKSLFALGYSLFGIHEIPGRIIQIGFLFGAAFIMYRFASEGFDERFPGVEIYATLLFLFLPPLWNVLWLNHLMMGTIFFNLLILYTFYRWYQTRESPWLVLFWFSFFGGLMYKRLVLFTLPVIALFILFDLKKGLFHKIVIAVKSLTVPALFTLPYFLYGKVFHYSPSGLTFERLANPLNIVWPLTQIPAYVGWAFTGLTIVAILWFLLAGERPGVLKLWLTYTLFAVVIITLTTAWGYMRHLMSIYVCLILFSSAFLSWGHQKLDMRWPSFVVLALILGQFGYLSLLSPNVEWINYRTSQYYGLPYEPFVEYLNKNDLVNEKIYAPMQFEPIHFYFYKEGLRFPFDSYKRRLWEQKLQDQSIPGLKKFLTDNAFEYLVVPTPDRHRQTRYSGIYRNPSKRGYPGAGIWWRGFVRDDLQDELHTQYQQHGFELVKQFVDGREELLLLRVPRGG